MTTPKDKVIPGTIVVISNVTMDTNIYNNKVPVVLTPAPGSVMDGHWHPGLGEELEVLSKPKKLNGINVVKVKYQGQEFFTYYCSIRYMTNVKE